MFLAAAMAAVGLPAVMANADSRHTAPYHHHRHGTRHVLNHASVGRPPMLRGPGYYFVPGLGIVGEACNLPTSACPNEMRDVNF